MLQILSYQDKYLVLPHLCLENHYQFITFRTYDSLDFYARTILEKDITIHIKDARAKKNMSKVNLEDLKEDIKCLN
jgi:hypothetical protein